MNRPTVFQLTPDARPPVDFRIANHGNVWAFTPITLAASDWWSDHIDNHVSLGGPAYVPRNLVDSLLLSLAHDGLRV